MFKKIKHKLTDLKELSITINEVRIKKNINHYFHRLRIRQSLLPDTRSLPFHSNDKHQYQ